MNSPALAIFEELALADLQTWSSPVSRPAVVRRSASLGISAVLPKARLERWAELCDGMVGDTLVFGIGEAHITGEWMNVVRRAEGGLLCIYSYDLRLDRLLANDEVPSAKAQHLSVWSRFEIARGIGASSRRIRAVWDRLFGE